MSPESVCRTAGIHRLPVGEQSWGDRVADLLVAAGLDGCASCDTRLQRKISAEAGNESYGLLFTSFVLAVFHQLWRLGYYNEAPAPLTGLDLFPGLSAATLHPQTRRVVSMVTFPAIEGTVLGVTAIGMPDGTGARAVLESMTPADREAVLVDVLDVIVGGIVAAKIFGGSAVPGS